MLSLAVLFAALCQLPAPADADDVAVPHSVVVKAEPARLTISVPNVAGVYTLTIVAGGRPTLAVQPEIIVLNPDGPVPPPPPPGPGPLSDFGKAIKAAADKATGDADRVNTAQGLAFIYRGISKEAHDKETKATVETISNTVVKGTDFILDKKGPDAVAAWADERATLRAGIADAIQKGDGEGKPLSVAKLGDLLDQAAAGLDASAPKTASQAPNPDFWKWLAETILPILLKLLIPTM